MRVSVCLFIHGCTVVEKGRGRGKDSLTLCINAMSEQSEQKDGEKRGGLIASSASTICGTRFGCLNITCLSKGSGKMWEI